jgi:TRAP-type C4-dicarboxylate transport system permease large subunit
MIYMQALERSGILDSVTALLLKTFYRRKSSLLMTVMVIIMFPGMITGSSTVAVLSTGTLVAPVLIRLGLSKIKAAALIAMGAILGMIAPPVNILVMIMGGGVDMPYVGLTLPLLIMVVPLAVVFALWLGYRDIRVIDRTELASILPPALGREYRWRIAIPLALVFLLLIVQGIPQIPVPDLGIPAIFLLGSLSCLAGGRRFNVFTVTQRALEASMPILAILAGVGMFIQVMTLTGGRGWIIVSFLALPPALLYAGIATSMPLFGAVSAYGSASILGVPFILALIEKNAIFTSAALSAVAGLGDLMPPTALAGIFAAQVVGESNYFKVLRLCLLPALLQLAVGIGVLLLTPWLEKLLF